MWRPPALPDRVVARDPKVPSVSRPYLCRPRPCRASTSRLMDAMVPHGCDGSRPTPRQQLVQGSNTGGEHWRLGLRRLVRGLNPQRVDAALLLAPL